MLVGWGLEAPTWKVHDSMNIWEVQLFYGHREKRAQTLPACVRWFGHRESGFHQALPITPSDGEEKGQRAKNVSEQSLSFDSH